MLQILHYLQIPASFPEQRNRYRSDCSTHKIVFKWENKIYKVRLWKLYSLQLTEYIFEGEKKKKKKKNYQFKLINLPLSFPLGFLKVRGSLLFFFVLLLFSQSNMLALPPRYSFFKASPKCHPAITYYRKHNRAESKEAKKRLCISPENVNVHYIIISNIQWHKLFHKYSHR